MSNVKTFAKSMILKILRILQNITKTLKFLHNINLILTNKPKYFQNSITIETGLSDFHEMTTTVLKTYFKNQNPKLSIESASFVL